MAKIKVYSEEELKEITSIAKKERGTWKEPLTNLANKYNRSYAAVYWKADQIGTGLGNITTNTRKGISKTRRNGIAKRKYTKKADKVTKAARKSYTYKKRKSKRMHKSPVADQNLHISQTELSFPFVSLSIDIENKKFNVHLK